MANDDMLKHSEYEEFDDSLLDDDEMEEEHEGDSSEEEDVQDLQQEGMDSVDIDGALELSMYENMVSVTGRLHYSNEIRVHQSAFGPYATFALLMKTKGKDETIRKCFLRTIVYGQNLIALVKGLQKGTFIKVTGSLDTYNNSMQIKAKQITPILTLDQAMAMVVESQREEGYVSEVEKERLAQVMSAKGMYEGEEESMELQQENPFDLLDLDGVPIEVLEEYAEILEKLESGDEDDEDIDISPEVIRKIDELAPQVLSDPERKAEAVAFLKRLYSRMNNMDLTAGQDGGSEAVGQKEAKEQKDTENEKKPPMPKTNKALSLLRKPRKSFL